MLVEICSVGIMLVEICSVEIHRARLIWDYTALCPMEILLLSTSIFICYLKYIIKVLRATLD
jgi:hypothetical protein